MKRKILSLVMLLCTLCLLSMARQMATARQKAEMHCPGESKSLLLPKASSGDLETSTSISTVHAIVLGI